MSSIDAFDIWRSRLDAIIKLAKVQQERYIGDMGERATEVQQGQRIRNQNDRENTLRSLPVLLARFGEQQFDFFARGFEATGGIILDKDLDDKCRVDISAAHAFSVILDQLANDLTVIQRAFEQRIVARLVHRTAEKSKAQGQIFDTLSTADQLAWHAKEMVQPYLSKNHFAGQTTVLSYLNKAPNVRVIPYAPVALIGIPLTALGSLTGTPPWARDFLAIPHEFAHHLYWYGRDFPNHTDQLDSAIPFLREQLAQECKSLIVQNWCEEIFADVVGCLIGGPVVALSMIDMVSAERGSQLLVDNGTHPLPILRPYIYTETLRQMGMKTMGEALERLWTERLKNFGYYSPDEAKATWQLISTNRPSNEEKGEPQTISMEELIPVIRKVIALLPLSPEALNLRWSDDTTDLGTLYTAFNQKMVELKPLQGGEMDTLHDWHLSKQSQDWPGQWQELVKNLRLLNGKFPATDKLDAEIWIKLLRFGGWTTEGPGSPRVGGS